MESPPSVLYCGVASAFSRGFAVTVLCPIGVVKTRMESSLIKNQNMRDVIAKLITAEPRKQLFAGLVPTLLRDVPFSSFYFGFYVSFRNLLRLDSPGMESNPLLNFAAAASAGCISSVLTHPPDVIRTRLQLANVDGTSSSSSSLLSTVQKMIRNEGWKSVWRGLFPRLVKRTVSTALTWTVFDEVSRKFFSGV